MSGDGISGILILALVYIGYTIGILIHSGILVMALVYEFVGSLHGRGVV